MANQNEIHEADKQTSAYVAGIVNKLVAMGGDDKTKGMSLAIAVAAQTFLALGGSVNDSKIAGEMVRAGVVTMLNAYRDMSRATHGPSGGIN